ncbi:MAG: polymer-forming cytoskeletal protein [Planctomycetes bacterium]|nr:polymer-forming cytoskeletal protein [Planctomycetota bacterium]MCH7767191.1 polymer-forming cytoskeletal protein [Acidobacteriota bacterium]
MADPKGDYPTTLGADAVFTGKLTFEKGVRLLGKFDGEIISEGQLLVANGAMLTGDVKAGAVHVEGEVKGNLSAKGKIQLASSARLEGDVKAAKLEVAEGAVLVGRCVIGTNAQAKPQEATKATDNVGLPASAPVATVVPSKARVSVPGQATQAAIRR